jgi:hypothetical protein
VCAGVIGACAHMVAMKGRRNSACACVHPYHAPTEQLYLGRSSVMKSCVQGNRCDTLGDAWGNRTVEHAHAEPCL